MSNCDLPAWSGRRIAMASSFGLTDFVADDAADGSTADATNCAAMGREAPPTASL